MTQPPNRRWTAAQLTLQSLAPAILLFTTVSVLFSPLHAASQQSIDTDFVLGQPDPREVIEVDTVQAFVAAIGSDRIIRLTADEYLLSSLQDIDTEHIQSSSAGFIIRNVENLTLEGPATLLTDLGAVPVLALSGCKDTRIDGLEMGHTPRAVEEHGACSGPVFRADDSNRIELVFCDLFGCGAYGLHLENTQGLLFEASRIYGCKLGLVQAKHCQDMFFNDSSFDDNVLDGFGMILEDCGAVTFRGSMAFDNIESGTCSRWTNFFFLIDEPASGDPALDCEYPTHVLLDGDGIEMSPFSQLSSQQHRVRWAESE